MKVGMVLPQSEEEGGGHWPEILALAQHAEASGLDSLWVCDHFVYRPTDGSEFGFHEPLTVLAALAGATSRVELGTLVLATSFRPPATLAKILATLHDVAGGRFIAGVGCGWYEHEYRAFGFPFDHRVGRFEEALRVVVPLLHGERVTFDGRWTTVRDAVILPPPVGRGPMVMVAAKSPRMLGLTAELADAWQTAWFGLPDARWRERLAGLRAACERHGRDPDSIDLTAGVDVAPLDTPAKHLGPSLAMDPAAIADGLAAWAAEGVAHVQLGVEAPDQAAIDVIANGIARFRRTE
jgi:probable F420-dependent oxidoreductase